MFLNSWRLKQTTRKLERNCCSTKSEESRLAWQDSLKSYRKALHNARAACYSALTEDNKNNPRFLFSTVARLTQSQSSLEPCIPIASGSDDFMTFFNNKIVLIREKIHQHLSSPGTDQSLITGSLDSALRPDVHLDCFAPTDFQQLTSAIISSRPTTCLSDPIPTKLLKETLPLLSACLLDMISPSLLTGYVPQSFKVAVLNLFLKSPLLIQRF